MKRIDVNEGWKFSPKFAETMTEPAYDDRSFAEVRLPHTVREIPFHYADEHEYQMVSAYRKHFAARPEWKDRRVFLTFDGIAHSAWVYLNGKMIGEHHCGYTAFSVELTEGLDFRKENVLCVKVDSREQQNIPPFGYVVDYMTFGGIYREVYLEVKEPDHIKDVFARSTFPEGLAGEKETAQLVSTVTIQRNDGPQTGEPLYIRQYLIDEAKESFLGESRMNGEVQESIFTVKEITCWSLEHPKLYCLRAELVSDGNVVDTFEVAVGFRSMEFRADGFFLNGKKIKIRGLNRHQSYPYVGYAMPESMQRLDADILKRELGCNAVRTSHYPQAHSFVDECDRIGLLVFMEFPGWQHIGDEAWKEQALVNLKEMILQYRNHPSIMLWGVRINESRDDDEFYKKTNALARKLDDSRCTGGVRAHKKSHLFEDVYTYNDFSHDGTTPGCEPKKKVTSDNRKAYLISEYNGHMYPTKPYDCEEHRLEHTLRHAQVLNDVAGQEDIAGSFGWCMFDYNTHKDFGSGDRICYHGVMDMFRNPKSAALVYECQQEEAPVLDLSSTMDIGEHPGCNRGKTFLFSNGDSVRMYKNDRFIKEYTKAQSPYPNLPHGPILIDDFIGDVLKQSEPFGKRQAAMIKEALNYVALHGYHFPPHIIWIAVKCMVFYHMKFTDAVQLYNKYVGDWGSTSTVYRFESVKNGEVVKTITKKPMTSLHLEAKASSDTLLDATTYDVAEVRLRMLDENDNQLYYFQEPLELSTEGVIELIGPNVIAMQGGMTGVYVRTTGEAGTGILHIKNAQAEECSIVFTVSADKSGEL